ncbi:hypothetical protein NDU88_000817 [Pleurodeles waltl]|uniref:Uncharacterized protein n=1 Tax=Pleurodeles waltl TaxID=8319 RepID=A0AAV7KWR3_PLEWA|nr:hypothetical protein NDU88_000817 [Pleurodeles waltl]
MDDVTAPKPICLIVSFLWVHQERDVFVDSTSYGHKYPTAREKWFQGLIRTSRTLMLLFPRRRDGMAAQDRVQCKIGITPMKRKCELEGKCWSGGHQCSLNSILTWCSSVVHFAV